MKNPTAILTAIEAFVVGFVVTILVIYYFAWAVSLGFRTDWPTVASFAFFFAPVFGAILASFAFQEANR